MPGKSRRVAARQGELSRRKRRAQRGPSGIPGGQPQQDGQQNGNGVAVAPEAPEVADANPAAQPQPAAATAVAPAARPPTRPAGRETQQREPARVRGERPSAYVYAGAEVRRIAVLSTVVLAALVALSFVF